MPKTTLLRKQVTQTGTIQPHAGGAAPEGYLVCDGTIVNIADYPKLYAIIGTSWGYGNNDGLTFHLPDLRGRFLRGVDNPSGIPGEEAGRDPDAGDRTCSNAGGNSGDAVGTYQSHAVQGHHHLTEYFNLTTGGSNFGMFQSVNPNNNTNTVDTGVGNVVTGGHGTANVSTETRPVNINVTYIIKVV